MLEELRFTLALVALREMEADGVSDPERRQDCLAAMEVRGPAGRLAGAALVPAPTAGACAHSGSAGAVSQPVSAE